MLNIIFTYNFGTLNLNNLVKYLRPLAAEPAIQTSEICQCLLSVIRTLSIVYPSAFSCVHACTNFYTFSNPSIIMTSFSPNSACLKWHRWGRMKSYYRAITILQYAK